MQCRHGKRTSRACLYHLLRLLFQSRTRPLWDLLLSTGFDSTHHRHHHHKTRLRQRRPVSEELGPLSGYSTMVTMVSGLTLSFVILCSLPLEFSNSRERWRFDTIQSALGCLQCGISLVWTADTSNYTNRTQHGSDAMV